ncbi:Sporulation related domain-containing protein [Parapedobacter koreensis]|uniref:Sporulation related domain-containing protein n=1 Tax=Parapedobacter koreensis TaxID=332977 RepID=A0A1H7J260_9SPHI|nr:Sporulation related domain-containing protein [Parapedobacter koreensis]
MEVPEIGVFTVTHVAASYDEEQSMFLPPTSHVALAESGRPDAFSIAAYVQVQYKVDEAAAKRILDEAIAKIMESISRNGQALLSGLGYLLADGASFVFKPFEAEGFGRKPVKEVAPVEKPLHTTAIEEVQQPVAVAETVVAADETTVAEESISEGRGSRWLIATVVVVVLLFAAVGWAWYYKPAWLERTKIASLFGREGDTARGGSSEPSRQPVQIPIVTVDTVALDTTQAQPVDSLSADSVVNPPEVVAKPAVTYEIIVGSFATMAQAEKYVAQMKAKGYELHAINSRMPGNRKKISWGSFETEEEAYRELARVQKTFEPGAWIAKVERDQ